MNYHYHVIKDPIYGTMQFNTAENTWIKPFIDHPLFQRLRHIKQLGLGDIIFPGAVHTRFNHSLGCCYIASQIASKIGLSPQDKQLAMIAALLHDIGHGPSSHALEGLFGQQLYHEEWTPYFLDEFKQDAFLEGYNASAPPVPLTADTLQMLAQMITPAEGVKKTVLSDIVSSQLDADRLDYLLRDSHFCGVRYGEFDFRWMLHCLTIVNFDSEHRLGITHKGIGVVEHYLMARRLMLRNIYHSQKKLAIETLMIQFFSQLADSMQEEHQYRSLKKKPLSQFLLAVRKFNHQCLGANNISTLKKNFLQTYFPLYQSLSDYDMYSLIKEVVQFKSKKNNTIQNIAEVLQFRHMPKIVRMDGHQMVLVKQELALFKEKNHRKYADWQLILVDTPERAYSRKEDPILVKNEMGEVMPIESFSLMLNAMSDRPEQITFLAIDRKIAEDKIILDFIDHLKKLRG